MPDSVTFLIREQVATTPNELEFTTYRVTEFKIGGSASYDENIKAIESILYTQEGPPYLDRYALDDHRKRLEVGASGDFQEIGLTIFNLVASGVAGVAIERLWRWAESRIKSRKLAYDKIDNDTVVNIAKSFIKDHFSFRGKLRILSVLSTDQHEVLLQDSKGTTFQVRISSNGAIVSAEDLRLTSRSCDDAAALPPGDDPSNPQ
jgi:hypothetical protein